MIIHDDGLLFGLACIYGVMKLIYNIFCKFRAVYKYNFCQIGYDLTELSPNFQVFCFRCGEQIGT